jgi:hypothetical protein
MDRGHNVGSSAQMEADENESNEPRRRDCSAVSVDRCRQSQSLWVSRLNSSVVARLEIVSVSKRYIPSGND